MIKPPARILQLMADPHATMFYCVKIKNLRITDYDRDLAIDGEIYTSSDLMVGVQAPKTNSAVDRSLYEINILDNTSSLNNLYFEGLIGAKASVFISFVDPADGVPETASYFEVYGGVVQGMETDFDTSEEGEVVHKIICSNAMAALDATEAFYTSRNYIRSLDASDSAFDQVFEGSGGVDLKWGKS